MARFRSIGGKWYPAKEHHIYSAKELKALGKDPLTDNPVYTGPDRDAVNMLAKEGVEFFGNDCRLQEETMIKARQLNCQTVGEYLKKYKGIDLDKLETNQRQLLEDTVCSDLEDIVRKPQVQPPSGGDDYSGQGKHIKGGLSDPKEYQVPGLTTGPGKEAVRSK